jgi:poly-gamma-glutamate capsule biosynthesis protein CapA/YwtB (metallophosphatase superfamily)
MNSVTISFVGDISLNGMYDDLLPQKGANFPFEQIKKEFDEVDIVSGNLESPFAHDVKKPEFLMKTPLKANPAYVEGLKWAGFNVMNLSNNHILDYGERAAAGTQEILEGNGIEHFGYGKDIESAKQLKVISVGSLKIGFIGYTDVVIDSPFYAGTDTRGIVKFDITSAREDTTRNKKQVDILVINLHWGIEYFHLPSPEQITHARNLIDSGADIVIGHHPHVLQGIERYKGGVIAYSLGNFVFSEILWEWYTPIREKRLTRYPLSRGNRKGAILQVEIANSGELRYNVIGTYLRSNGQIGLRMNVEKDIDFLSRPLLSTNYERHFQNDILHFNRRLLVKNHLSRFCRVYKIRPKHIKEVIDLIRTLS